MMTADLVVEIWCSECDRVHWELRPEPAGSEGVYRNVLTKVYDGAEGHIFCSDCGNQLARR